MLSQEACSACFTLCAKKKSEEEEAAATKHLSFSIHLFTPSLHEEEERLPYIFFHYGLDFFLSNYNFFLYCRH